MEISLDKINLRNEPYQQFLDGIRSQETARKYKNALHAFLKLVPNQVYTDALGEIPDERTPEKLSEFFVKLSQKQPELATNIIAAFIKEERKLVERKEMSSQTLPNHIKPIKVLLDSNGVPIHWKTLYKLMPKRESATKDRAYTKEEIQKMLKISNDITDHVILLMSSSAGFRVEAWDYFTWDDVVFFRDDYEENDDNNKQFKGAALRIYKGDPEEYWTFITPEACNALDIYREKWKSDVGRYPHPHDPLIRSSNSPMVIRLQQNGIKKRLGVLVKAIGLRNQLEPGKRRFEVQLTHGFRKYFNTMMRRAKVDYLDKEDMMGHKVGLEKHYERYNEEDFERFSEYQKAIPFLTISKEENQKLELAKKEKELKEEKTAKRQLEKKIEEVKNLEKEKESFEKMKEEFKEELLDELKSLKPMPRED